MNSGKFFKLNLEDSKIVDKVAIYDYIDLPAYKETQKRISPKYPISLCITQDSLQFILHYCAFHDEETDAFCYGIADYKGKGPLEMVHMQEIILEIPFTNNSMLPVSDCIKDLYINFFPVYLNEKNDVRKSDGSFLKKTLDKVYNWGYYKEHSLDHSFSNLWLMGNLRENGQYVGFLRKLLLDFMFDLKHSEVFQTAASYQEMYSGLMSDFYFSTLMHKCEYYYYRSLTLDAIYDLEKLVDISKNDKDKRKECVRELYATKLFEAEKAWVEDITNPLAETFFKENDDDFISPKNDKLWVRIKRRKNILAKHLGLLQKWWKKENRSTILVYLVKKWWKNFSFKHLFRTGKFITRPNWFADPEEEMRRVCFTMTEPKKPLSHLCNSETVAEYLKIKKQDGIMNLRAHISRWFLRRNAFSDVLHLHFFKFAHVVIPVLVLFVAAWILLSGSTFFSQDWWCNHLCLGRWALALWMIVLGVSVFWWIKKPYTPKKANNKRDIEVLIGWRKRLVAKRMFWWALLGGVDLLLAFIAINAAPQYNKLALVAAVVCLFAALILSWTSSIHIKLIKNVHLLLPRLVASIAAAWLTLAIGNELFQSFFDALPSWLTCGLLSFVVLFFILYEMNKSIPNKSGFVKLIRSVEMLVISYLVAIVVGLFIINFTGERFMERSGYLETFHNEYLAKGGDKTGDAFQQDYHYDGVTLPSDTPNRLYLENLEHLTITRHGAEVSSHKPVLTYWDIHLWHDYHFFILRDFLIQFAFLAMFIGVFIQMIFEEKSITET